jgi:hypothetical protein
MLGIETLITLGFPFSKRDFIYTRYDFINEETKAGILLFSIERDDLPPVPKVVRGIILTSGTLIEQDSKDHSYTLLSQISHVDLQGNFPLWLMNKMHFESLREIKRMAKKLEASKK